ncbi:MAG: hypothetical protein C5B49_00635 [Bdellovibrio sp.]|nr:MAG: hypothetical protein C5B49_00635 [Bdellovibrio sp.]
MQTIKTSLFTLIFLVGGAAYAIDLNSVQSKRVMEILDSDHLSDHGQFGEWEAAASHVNCSIGNDGAGNLTSNCELADTNTLEPATPLTGNDAKDLLLVLAVNGKIVDQSVPGLLTVRTETIKCRYGGNSDPVYRCHI